MRRLLPVAVVLILFPAGTLHGKTGPDDKRVPNAAKPTANRTVSESKGDGVSRVVVAGNNPLLVDESNSLASQVASTIWSKIRRPEPGEEYLWTCFSVRLRDDLTASDGSPAQTPVRLSISAMGLGATKFALLDANGCANSEAGTGGPPRTCQVFRGTGGGWTNGFGCWASIMALNLDQQERIVGVRIPVGLVPQAGDVIEGKIVVNEFSQKPIEVPLKIEKPSDPFSTSVQWFLGIAVPALATLLFGYIALKVNTRVATRTEQRKKFAEYKVKEHATLNSLFSNLYPIYFKEPFDSKQFAAELSDELRKSILENLPEKERKKLLEALSRCEVKRIKKRLIVLFVEWKEQIKNPAIPKD